MMNEDLPIDVSTMRSMSNKQYREYLRSEDLMFLDVHGILRLTAGGTPLAATAAQVDVLLEELRQFKMQMRKE